MKTVVHVTHEAVQKIGGIGAVIHGLLTSDVYSKEVGRNVMLGPLFWPEHPKEQRLPDGQVLYSSIDGMTDHPLAEKFRVIEQKYSVALVYGKKDFFDPLTGIRTTAEVILVDVRNYRQSHLNDVKAMLFSEYAIESARYQHVWDYEQYLRIATPGLDALFVIGAAGDEHEPPVILSHEYMGMPTALVARSWYKGKFKTIFYAHEVATMRRIVENAPGMDTMFYNVLEAGHKKGQYVEHIFGSQADYYKHPLVLASRHCDNIFAVGDYVVKELRFLDQAFEDHPIDLAYNGVPTRKISVYDKLKSRDRLREYCNNILGFTPDVVLTHVTRLVPSKGLWRDLLVMEQLEPMLRRDNRTAVLLVLSTETAARSWKDVMAMEAEYYWPIAHREGLPDLTGGEARYYAWVQATNARCRNGKVVFINQFGFTHESCGTRMPAEMEWLDIRKGSDAEFGQSIYEPFGIAQVEPISFGGICVFTKLCGCAGFVRQATKGKPTRNAIEVDYTQIKDLKLKGIEQLVAIDQAQRQQIEVTVARRAAEDLYGRLPKGEKEMETLVESGYDLASQMSWDVVARDYVLPGIARALAR